MRQALPWLEGSVQGVTHVGIFTFTTATALVMYLYAVFTDPGRCVGLGVLWPQADRPRFSAQRAAQLGARRGGCGVHRG